jgi:hypothetical protein
MFSRFKKRNDIESFITDSIVEVHSMTGAHNGNWRLGEEQSWSIDLDNGHILFSFADGTQAVAPIQIVGTFDAKDDTFMWGWGHPSVTPPLQKNASLVKAFGRKHGSKELTKKKVPCTEKRAWEYTALAMRLGEAKGVYRAEAANGTFVFMNFGEVQLAKSSDKHWASAVQGK